MAHFNRGGSRGGGFGGRDGGRPNFQKRSFGGRGDGRDREVTLYDAVCSNCGKDCQVPFRPTGVKPVYCKECFSKMGGPSAGGNDRFSRPQFDRGNDRPRPQFDTKGPADKASHDEIKKQLSSLNAKVDQLMAKVEALKSPVSQPVAVPTPEKSVKKEKKSPSKKSKK